MGWGGRRSRGRRRPGSSPRHSRAPGEEHFISLLGKIHAFCMVDLNKKGALHTRIPRLRDRSGARKTDKSREAEYKRGVDQRLLETRSQISRKRAGARRVYEAASRTVVAEGWAQTLPHRSVPPSGRGPGGQPSITSAQKYAGGQPKVPGDSEECLPPGTEWWPGRKPCSPRDLAQQHMDMLCGSGEALTLSEHSVSSVKWGRHHSSHRIPARTTFSKDVAHCGGRRQALSPGVPYASSH